MDPVKNFSVSQKDKRKEYFCDSIEWNRIFGYV